MSDATLNNHSPDTAKHVNYTQGMVLGVDDFVQEFGYLSGRDSLLAREIIGYGTVCGLQVIAQTDALGSRIRIKPGAAITPKGQFVRVNEEQCAQLNDWLALPEVRDQVVAALGLNTDGILPLYVKLCYRECLTDKVPIPGEPCRSEDDALAPSRIKDDFKLELSFSSPEQREEQGLRNFVAWLSEIPIEDSAGAATLEEFLTAVRGADLSLGHVGSSMGSTDAYHTGSGLFIHPADACDFLHAAFRVWVTELRPKFLGTDQTCAGNPPKEGCVMLARLRVPVLLDAGTWKVKAPSADPDSQVQVLEDDRPFVLSLRTVQEWMLCGRSHQAGTAGGVGPKGAKGDAGDPGRDGTNGRDGVDGAPGRDGANGLNGADGAPGRDGAAGRDGRDGVNGAPGLNGVDGAPGLNGVEGAPGRDGINGAPGLNGVDGAPGLNGADGQRGPAGDSRIQVAGCFDAAGQPINNAGQIPPRFAFDLTASMFPGDRRFFLLSFDRFKPTGFYVVKGTVLVRHDDPGHVFEVVSIDDESIDKLISRIGDPNDANLKKFIDSRGQTGIVVRVMQTNTEPGTRGFMVEISNFGGG